VDLVSGRDIRCGTTQRRDVRERGHCGGEGGGCAARTAEPCAKFSVDAYGKVLIVVKIEPNFGCLKCQTSTFVNFVELSLDSITKNKDLCMHKRLPLQHTDIYIIYIYTICI
jgi:hypothetical protein